VARAHAAVVNHHVYALWRVYRSAHRANIFAGRILAVLAHHRLEERAGIEQVAGEIGIDAEPLHVAPDLDLLFAYDGHIVFRLAGNHAGIDRARHEVAPH